MTSVYKCRYIQYSRYLGMQQEELGNVSRLFNKETNIRDIENLNYIYYLKQTLIILDLQYIATFKTNQSR